MNGKKANRAFLITILCYIGMVLAFAFLPIKAADSLVLNNLICEAIVILPILLFALASGEKLSSFLGFHKIKFSSVCMTGLFTFLSMPLLGLLNLITQLWVENEVAATMESYQAGQMPFLLLYLSVGLIAPVFEEAACRGAYYRSYRRMGGAWKGMFLSSLIFALMHMNFNQAAYAFAMGILAVLLVEASGSLWSSILYHGFVNGSQVILIYGVFRADPNAYSEQAAGMGTDILIYGIAFYLILTAVALPLAWAVLVWIGRNEGRDGALAEIWRERKEKKDKLLTIPFILALILCLAMMTGILFEAVMQIVKIKI